MVNTAAQIPGRTPMSRRDDINLPNPDGGDVGLICVK